MSRRPTTSRSSPSLSFPTFVLDRARAHAAIHDVPLSQIVTAALLCYLNDERWRTMLPGCSAACRLGGSAMVHGPGCRTPF